MEFHKRTLTAAEVEHIRETLHACASEFDELFRTKEWFVTSVTDQIESSLEILNNKEVEDNGKSLGLGSGNIIPQRQRRVRNRRQRSGRIESE